MTKVFLREKKLLHGKINLYLDFYPPIIHPETRTLTRRQHLKLYIFERPKTETEREHNKETRLLGEHIRAKQQLQVQASDYGFLIDSGKKYFLEFFQGIVESKRRKTDSTHYTWKATLAQFEEFTKKVCRFEDVGEQLCIDFKDYLSDKTELVQNSQKLYFEKFRSVCRSAVKKRIAQKESVRECRRN